MPDKTSNLIYGILRSHLKAGESVSAESIATEAGVSISTVYRFAKRSGYQDWSDCLSQLESFYRSVKREAANASEIDYERLAQLIIDNRSKTMLVDALGDAEVCRDHLIYRFGSHGISAMRFSPDVAQAFAERDESGLAFVINESGVALQETCRSLAQSGFKIIAITANPNSPVARLATYAVIVQNNKSTLAAYQPNYFAATVLIVLERTLAKISDCADNSL